MKPFFLPLLLAFGLPWTPSVADNSEAASGRAAIEYAVAKVKPALVRIHVVSTSYRNGREMKFQSSGSGVIISDEGHVVTNHHVAGHAKRLLCTLSDRSEVEAELIGTDATTDIAVIKLSPERAPYPFVTFGDSDAVLVGDRVLAMGSPLSLSQSVTLGIVSNTEMVMPRRMGFGEFRLDGEDVGSMVKWIGHDAEIFPGNSGGPLVDLQGNIIGINEISFGLGGAIPGNLAKRVADDLIEYGMVPRSWLGITVQPLLKHGDLSQGILVTGAIDGSPAAEGGVQSGDILIELAGEPVRVRYDEELPDFNRLVASLPIGKTVTAKVIREDELKNLKLTTTQREDRRPKEREFKQWGVTGRNISFVISKELKRDSQDGVMITSVAPGGPAGDAKPGIRARDILVKVGDDPIKDLDDLVETTAALTQDATEPVPVLATFERKAATFVTAVEVGIRELNDPGLEVKKAWLPVSTQVITRDISKLFGDENLKGFRITQVYPKSTAAEAGLETGDLITGVDGRKLTASAPEHYEELETLIRNYRVGTTVELSVIRNGTSRTIPVELVRAPKLDREMKKYRDENFGFTAREITFFDKADEQWEQGQAGLLVTEVQSGGWAELGMLRVGDLIQRIAGQTVASVDDLESTMSEVAENRESAVVIEVLRGIYTIYIELEPKWDEQS